MRGLARGLGLLCTALALLYLAQAVLEKFGGDSLGETQRNFESYVSGLSGRKGR